MPERKENFIRATLIHEEKRADILLPSNMPVVELIPSVVRRFVSVTPRMVSRGFILTTPNGQVVDQSLTLKAQGINDGTLLMLSPRVKEIEKKYDDPIEAVADVVNETNRPWTDADAAGVATGAAITLLVASAILLCMARPLAGISIPIILGGMAVLLIGVIWALQRGERHTHAAALALVSSVIVGACGFSVPNPPVTFSLDMALGGFCCSIAAMLTMPLLSEWKEIMFAPAVAGISLGTVGAVNMALTDSHERVAVVATSLLGIFLLVLPGLSMRLSRLDQADPLLASGGGGPAANPGARREARPINPRVIKDRYLRGRRAMFAARCGAGFALAVLTPFTVASGKWGVVVIAGILIILTVGSRVQYAKMDVMSEYVIAVLVFAIGCSSVMMLHSQWWLGLVIVLAVVASILIAYGLVIGKTPQWLRQTADMSETIAGIVLIPAAVLALRLW